MDRKKVTMVGNSHIDLVWLWREGEGFQAVRATFASALERMKEFPEFEYTASSSVFYEWLEEHCPAMLEEIRERVREGRWHLAGGWWLEPDCNIPGGESLIRQGLYGQRTLLRLFGQTASFGYNVDSFGHQAGIPAILSGQRMRGYVFMRPFPDQWKLPAPAFRWEAEDGSTVIGQRCGGEYCAWTRTAIVDNLEKTLAGMAESGLSHLPVYYGVGNHGGGPTIENIKCIRELRRERADLDIANGGPEDFFDTVDPDSLPVYRGEMEGTMPGCYTVDAELKRLCRETETALLKTEILSVMAGCEEQMQPMLTEDWKRLMTSQFHDTLAGTARRESRDDTVMDLHGCLSDTRRAVNTCLQRLSDRFDLRGDGFPLLVVNPTDQPWDGLVETDIEWRSKFPMRLKDAAGVEQPYDASVIRLTSPDTRKHFVFRGQVPAFGTAVYRLMPEAPTLHAEPMNCPENTLENEFLRAVIDPQTGALVRLTELDTGRELLAGPVLPVIYEDSRDTWGSAGEIGAKRGEYRAEKVYREENGVLRTTVTCRMIHGRSEGRIRWSLAKGERQLRIGLRLDSREKLACTALRIPLRETYETALAEAACTETERPLTEEGERCMQRYLDLTGPDGGMLVLNRAKYGYRWHEGALEILLMRGAVHAFGSGENIRDDREYDYADQGVDETVLVLAPHRLPLRRAERVRAAQRLHMPPETLSAEQHIGDEPCRTLADTLSLKGSVDVVVTALKRGEEGGLVLRLQNGSDKPETVHLCLRGNAFSTLVPPLATVTAQFRDGLWTLTDFLEIHDET